MRKPTIAVLGTFALALGLGSPAGAASSVDITYDLSGTDFLNSIPVAGGPQIVGDCPEPPNLGGGECAVEEIVSSSMKIRYTGDSASSMPILHGPATLQSLTLQELISIQYRAATYTVSFSAANMNIQLLSPVVGSLLSSGKLTFGSAQLRVTGTRHCGLGSYASGLCIAFGGVLTSIPGPLGPYTIHATFTLAASAGPYGGAQSTRHTVSGTIPVAVQAALQNFFGQQRYFMTQAAVVGREVLREAEGHDPKVTPIPEPGTLLLLGAGTVGLALVGRATRRSRQS